MESSGPALQAHQSVPNDRVYHDDQVVTGNGDQEVYEEITLHIGEQSMVTNKGYRILSKVKVIVERENNRILTLNVLYVCLSLII